MATTVNSVSINGVTLSDENTIVTLTPAQSASLAINTTPVGNSAYTTWYVLSGEYSTLTELEAAGSSIPASYIANGWPTLGVEVNTTSKISRSSSLVDASADGTPCDYPTTTSNPSHISSGVSLINPLTSSTSLIPSPDWAVLNDVSNADVTGWEQLTLFNPTNNLAVDVSTSLSGQSDEHMIWTTIGYAVSAPGDTSITSGVKRIGIWRDPGSYYSISSPAAAGEYQTGQTINLQTSNVSPAVESYVQSQEWRLDGNIVSGSSIILDSTVGLRQVALITTFCDSSTETKTSTFNVSVLGSGALGFIEDNNQQLSVGDTTGTNNSINLLRNIKRYTASDEPDSQLSMLRDWFRTYSAPGRNLPTTGNEVRMSHFYDATIFGVVVSIKNESDSKYDNSGNGAIYVRGVAGANSTYEFKLNGGNVKSGSTGQVGWGGLGGTGWNSRYLTYTVSCKDETTLASFDIDVTVGLGGGGAKVTGTTTAGGNGTVYTAASQSSSTASDTLLIYIGPPDPSQSPNVYG